MKKKYSRTIGYLWRRLTIKSGVDEWVVEFRYADKPWQLPFDPVYRQFPMLPTTLEECQRFVKELERHQWDTANSSGLLINNQGLLRAVRGQQAQLRFRNVVENTIIPEEMFNT